MFPVLFLLCCGIASGICFRKYPQLLSSCAQCATITVYVLLFLLGLLFGSNSAVLQNFGKLGAIAVLIASASIMGSIFFAVFVYRIFFQPHEK